MFQTSCSYYFRVKELTCRTWIGMKVHQGPMSSLTKRKNSKIVRNINKLKHYTNLFQVKL